MSSKLSFEDSKSETFELEHSSSLILADRNVHIAKASSAEVEREKNDVAVEKTDENKKKMYDLRKI